MILQTKIVKIACNLYQWKEGSSKLLWGRMNEKCHFKIVFALRFITFFVVKHVYNIQYTLNKIINVDIYISDYEWFYVEAIRISIFWPISIISYILENMLFTIVGSCNNIMLFSSKSLFSPESSSQLSNFICMLLK